MKAIEVKALPNYQIDVSFEDGIRGTINLNDLVQKGIFHVLNDEVLFSKVYTNCYSMAWSEELEIDALTIYAEFMNKQPEELFEASKSNATN